MEDFTPIRTLKDIYSTLSPTSCDLLTSLRFVDYPTGFTAGYNCNCFTASLGLGCQPSWRLGIPSPLPSPYLSGQEICLLTMSLCMSFAQLVKRVLEKTQCTEPSWSMDSGGSSARLVRPGPHCSWLAWLSEDLPWGSMTGTPTRQWTVMAARCPPPSLSSATCQCTCLRQRLRRPS